MTDSTPQPIQQPPSGAEPKYYTMPERFLVITRGKAAAPSAPRSSLPSAEPPVAATFRSPSDGGAPTPKLQQPAPGAGKRRMMLVWGVIGAVVVIGGAIAAWWVLRSIPSPDVRPEIRDVRSEQVPPSPAPAAPDAQSAIENRQSKIPPPPPPPALPAEPETQPQAPVEDGDGDGLTSDEERLFGTDDANEDTDGDGYADRAEVLNLYHPGSTEPARLLDAGLVFEYAPPHSTLWSLSVPRGLEVMAMEGALEPSYFIRMDEREDGERILLEEVSYPPTLDLSEWMQQRPDGRALPPLEDVSSAHGATGVRRAGEPVYFAIDSGRALRIEHIIPTGTPRYATVYAMMVNSVSVQ